MKKTLLLILLICLVSNTFAQQEYKKNGAYIQFLGNGLLLSINYERQLFKKPLLAINAGLGIYGSSPTNVTIPIGLKYLLRTKNENNFVQFGIGTTYTNDDEVVLYTSLPKYNQGQLPKPTNWNFLYSIGYRSVSKNNWLFTTDAMLFFNNIHNGLPYIGISVGKVF